MTFGLLLVWFALWAYLSFRQVTKKDYFDRKIKQLEVAKWEAEFKIAQSRQIREGIRKDRDMIVEAIARVETHLEGTKDKEEKKKLEEEIKKLKDNKELYEKQMKMIDEQTEGGAGPTPENPAGIGLNEQLTSVVKLLEMTKEYRKTL